MSMHAKLNVTMINRDTNAYKELLHEDCVLFFIKVVTNLVKQSGSPW